MRPLAQQLRNVRGITWHWSAASARQEPIFRAILDAKRPTRIVEVGTFQGVSTALLAQYAPVTTIDVLPDKMRDRVWSTARIQGRITELVCRTSSARDRAISDAIAEADLAFVDGSHLMRDVTYDFELTIPCGCVVLHDYRADPDHWPDVGAFVDALDPKRYDVELRVPFAVVAARR